MTKEKSVAVRIIGGTLRGRKLEVPSALGLRPTGDRVRETLFNWLQGHIVGSRCLDVFAGSGGLGLEAYSRGAKSVLSIELNSKVFQVLAQRKVDWKLEDHYQVKKSDGLAFLSLTSPAQYDLIFLDPPFQKNFLNECVDKIQKSKCLAEDGLLYIERPIDQSLPEGLEQVKESKAGGVIFGLYRQKL